MNKSLITIALLSSLFICSFQIVGFITFGNFAFLNFEIDEFTYYKLAADLAKNISSSNYLQVLLSRPNALFDLVLGLIINYFDKHIVILNFLLDFSYTFICFIICYFLFRKFFNSFTSKLASLIFLLSGPLIYLTYSSIQISPDYLYSSLVHPAMGYLGVSTTRGLYTQLSVIIFALSVLSCLNGTSHNRNAHRYLYFSFLLCGINSYVYFFGWLASFLTVFLTSFLNLLIPKNSPSKERIKDFFFANIIHILIVIPSVLIMTKRTGGIVKHKLLGDYFAFPLIDILIIIILITLYFSKKLENSKSLFILVISLCISNSLLLNIQPLLKQGIPTRYFGGFYLCPLYFSLIICFAFNKISTFLHTPIFRRLYFSLFILSLLFSLLPFKEKFSDISMSQASSKDLKEVLIFMQSYNNSKIALMSYKSPFSKSLPESFPQKLLPEVLKMFANVDPLHSDWNVKTTADWEDTLKRELLMGFIFSGELKFVLPCQKEMQTEMPGDIFDLTWTYLKLRRQQQCNLYYNLPSKTNVCELLSNYKIDLILKTGAETELPLNIEKYSTPLFISSNKHYTTYNFNYEQAKDDFCK